VAACTEDATRNDRQEPFDLESNTKKVPILYATVTGKRGSREIIRSEAVDILTNRWTNDRFEDDLVFPEHHRDAFRELLIAANLRKDAAGFPRNFKSVRATAISQAILRRTPLLFVARNAGVAYNVIDQYYAKRLDATMAADDLTN
jgi:hypothetical protein